MPIKVNNQSSLTAGELIELLQKFNSDTPVYFQYNYGDHWRTQVAQGVTNAEEKLINYSSYHNMNKVMDDDSIEGVGVIVLS